MKYSDKFISAFLISAGLFSAAQAVKYVETLSAKDKKNLLSVATDKSVQIHVAAGAEMFTEGSRGGKGA